MKYIISAVAYIQRKLLINLNNFIISISHPSLLILNAVETKLLVAPCYHLLPLYAAACCASQSVRDVLISSFFFFCFLRQFLLTVLLADIEYINNRILSDLPSYNSIVAGLCTEAPQWSRSIKKCN